MSTGNPTEGQPDFAARNTDDDVEGHRFAAVRSPEATDEKKADDDTKDDVEGHRYSAG